MLTEKGRNGKKIKTMDKDLFLLMKKALSEAQKGFDMGEVPIGALITGPEGNIVAQAHNRPISMKDPTAHAEILVLREAGAFYQNYRLQDTTLVVTVEPCPMCMGAALNARISRLVFGALDPKSGAAGSLYNLASDTRLNHRIEIISGIMEQECSKLLQDFFRHRRRKNNL